MQSLAGSVDVGERFSYHVPNTYTTLHLTREESPQYMLATIRMLLSRSLFEVGSILQTEGDGILPGSEHGYEKLQHVISEHNWERAHMTIVSSMPHGIQDHLMTYQILHDTLVGLWNIAVIHRQIIYIQHTFSIEHRNKGIVGLGSFRLIERW